MAAIRLKPNTHPDLRADIRELDPKVLINFGMFAENNPVGKTRVLAHDLSPSAVVWEVTNLLSPAECAVVLAAADAYTPVPADNPTYRDASRLVTFSSGGNLVETLEQRLRNGDGLCARLLDENCVPVGFASALHSPEAWSAPSCELNPCLRISTYVAPSNGFATHRDAPYTASWTAMSDHTLVICLCAADSGGDIVFYDVATTVPSNKAVGTHHVGLTPTEELESAVTTTPVKFPMRLGCAFIFDQRLLHGAEPVTDGVKCVLRTDLIRRVMPTDDLKNRISAGDIAPPNKFCVVARMLFRAAELADLDGNVLRAKECYERSLSLRQGAVAFATCRLTRRNASMNTVLEALHPRVLELLKEYESAGAHSSGGEHDGCDGAGASASDDAALQVRFVARSGIDHVFSHKLPTLTDTRRLAAALEMAAHFTLRSRVTSLRNYADATGDMYYKASLKTRRPQRKADLTMAKLLVPDFDGVVEDTDKIENHVLNLLDEDYNDNILVDEAEWEEDDECDDPETYTDAASCAKALAPLGDDEVKFTRDDEDETTTNPSYACNMIKALLPPLRQAKVVPKSAAIASGVGVSVKLHLRRIEFEGEKESCGLNCSGAGTCYVTKIRGFAPTGGVGDVHLQPGVVQITYRKLPDGTLEGSMKLVHSAESFNHASCQCEWELEDTNVIRPYTAWVTFDLTFVATPTTIVVTAVPTIIV
jgi:hypothetical protein